MFHTINDAKRCALWRSRLHPHESGLGSVAVVLALVPKLRTPVVTWYRTRLFRLRKAGFETVASPKNVAIVTGAIAVYNGAASLWGNNLAFFADHPRAHDLVKLTACALLFAIAILTVLRERWKERSLVGTEVLFAGFVEFVGTVVQHKVNRFADKAADLPHNKVFDRITQPAEQLRFIFMEGAHFLSNAFKLREEQIDFTVIERRNGGPWTYYQKLKPWNHENPNALVVPNSCAYDVLKSGEATFHASKRVAAGNGLYIIGSRDDDDGDGDGSIYCEPLSVKCREDQWEFIISIVTYGARFCDPCDESNEQKTQALLREITRRIKLELHLRAIKGTAA